MKIEYHQSFDRNIGLLDEKEQQLIRESHAAVFGMGGLGGVISEILVRAGVGSLTIIDRDVFEPSNLNRQVLRSLTPWVSGKQTLLKVFCTVSTPA